uniref:Uncharacterized protein n=1 Tax=Cacopsylla melanoneura TaxID=428564 RepID=A0A8D8ZH95_9HEMI
MLNIFPVLSHCCHTFSNYPPCLSLSFFLHRRKKRCIRYVGKDDGNQSEDKWGSCGSIGPPPDDDMGSISSPGGLSGLSSLTSPSMILPSPSSLASPCMYLQSPLTLLSVCTYVAEPPF